ncbi:MAG: hypothetical protein BAJATHORv1_70096 [Candidatus Thorarchaeota archaeon]|nr:MAG: hypothetical protein BAJATHORv1_70096 [Candidatus Thorarchaeota archaeon]
MDEISSPDPIRQVIIGKRSSEEILSTAYRKDVIDPSLILSFIVALREFYGFKLSRIVWTSDGSPEETIEELARFLKECFLNRKNRSK